MRRTRLLVTVGAGLALLALSILPTRRLGAQSVSSGYYSVPYTACQGSASGNTTGTQGFQAVGTAAKGAQQVVTSATGTNTHTYVCDITPPSRFVSGTTGAFISDAVVLYNTQNQLGAQVATLASGTFNSTIVFTKVAFPTAGAGESQSTDAPARADTGTLTITPTTVNFNVTTGTAGQYYTVKFTPATAFAVADLTKYYLQMTLQGLALTPTTTNVIGVLVHTR